MSWPHTAFKFMSRDTFDCVFVNEKIRISQTSVLNDLFEGDLDYIRVLKREIKKRCSPCELEGARAFFKEFSAAMRHFRSEVGILSLTKNICNELMWAHYADSHRGVAIELDLGLPMFCRGTVDCLDQILGAAGINKQDVGHPFNMLPDIFRRPIEIDYDDGAVSIIDLLKTDIYKPLFRKKECWAYEDEVRILYRLGLNPEEDENLENDGDGKAIHLLNLPPRSIKSLTFGRNANAFELLQEMHDWGLPDSFHGAEFYRVVRRKNVLTREKIAVV